MAKKYRLVRDIVTPRSNIKSGSEFIKTSYTEDGAYTHHNYTLHPKYVENNPDWFEEVVEKEFVWDDKTVERCVNYCKNSGGNNVAINIGHFKRHIESMIPAGEGTANDVLNTEEKNKFEEGFDFACQMLDDLGYTKTSKHPFNIADCLRFKRNKLPKNKVRENKSPLYTTESINEFLDKNSREINEKMSSPAKSKPTANDVLNTEKEWEIVAVYQGMGSYTDVDKNGKIRYAHFAECSIEDALQNRGYKIYSVKRLSDGEVFSVGDEVRWALEELQDAEPFTIKSFQINDILPIKRMFCNNQNIDICYLTKPTPSQPQNNKEDQVKNIEEKAFWAAKCGIVTKWSRADGFSTNNISPVNTIEEYRNHPEYKKYLEREHPHKSLP